MKTVLSAISYLGMTRKAWVECEIKKGVGIHIVGIPDEAAKEGLLRVVTALQECGYKIPGKRIVIHIVIDGLNIASANLPIKVYQSLDLAIAVAMLADSGQLRVPASEERFIGMLGLDGSLEAPYTGLKNKDDSAICFWYALKDVRTFGWPMKDKFFCTGWKSRGGLREVVISLNLLLS